MSGVLGVLLGSNGAAASGDAAETTAFLARTSGLDATHTNAYKALINGLVSDGVFATKLDALYILATQDATTANLNLISTSYTLVPSIGSPPNPPIFTADRGYTGDLTGGGANVSYLETNFNPFTAGGNYTQNSAHIGVYSRTTGGNTTNQRHGWLDASAVTEGSIAVIDSANAAENINAGFSSDVTSANAAAGHAIGNRSGAGATQLYLNGSSVATGTQASVALTNAVTIWFLARHLGTAPNQASDEQIIAAHFGGSLTAGDVTNLNTRLTTFKTAVGA